MIEWRGLKQKHGWKLNRGYINGCYVSISDEGNHHYYWELSEDISIDEEQHTIASGRLMKMYYSWDDAIKVVESLASSILEGF